MRQIIFYVNPAWRNKGGIHTPLLNPWWGNPLTESSLYTKQLFDSFSFDTNLYTITEDLNLAEAVLVPYPHIWYMRHNKALFNECVRAATVAKLPLLVDGTGDIEYPIHYDNVITLRYGGYRFLKEAGRLQIPLFVDDLLLRYRNGEQTFRNKNTEMPVVGFAGWAKLTPSQHIKTLVKEIPIRAMGVIDTHYRACKKGVLWRMRAIKTLTKSQLVSFTHQSRSSFSGSSKTAEGDLRELQKQMVDVILGSDYALDVRGDANNSARLFEILSLGRIPVIIDTERNFPFSDKIDYNSFSLIVDFRDIDRLPERIYEFHKNISTEQFIEMQNNARNAFVNYFRIDAMTRLIMDEIRERIQLSDFVRRRIKR